MIRWTPFVLCAVAVSSLAFCAAEPVKEPAGSDPPNLKRVDHPAIAAVETYQNSVKIQLTLIPKGEFDRGTGASRDEQPVHRVRISQDFFMGIYEVTQEQWKAVMGTEPWKDKGALPVGDKYPAMCTWEDCDKFCKKLSGIEKARYRLPTEAEWEYACRAGSTGRYCFGNDSDYLRQYAWMGKVRGQSQTNSKSAQEVGKKLPNAFGLYDMHGNLSEWCNDWYQSEYYSKFSKRIAIDPQGPPGGELFKVMRGGDWFSDEDDVRSAKRSAGLPRDREKDRRTTTSGKEVRDLSLSDMSGFRVVMVKSR